MLELDELKQHSFSRNAFMTHITIASNGIQIHRHRNEPIVGFHFMAQRCNLSTNHFRFNRSNKIKYRRKRNIFLCSAFPFLCSTKPCRLFHSLTHGEAKGAAVVVITFQNGLDLRMESSKIIVMGKQR